MNSFEDYITKMAEARLMKSPQTLTRVIPIAAGLLSLWLHKEKAGTT